LNRGLDRQQRTTGAAHTARPGVLKGEWELAALVNHSPY